MLKLNLLIAFTFIFLASPLQNGLAQEDNETEALMKQMERDRQALMQATEDAQAQLTDPTTYSSKPGSPPAFDIDGMLAPYRSATPEETKQHLRQKLKGKPIVDNPKMVNFLDSLIRDERALKDASEILSNKKKLGAFVAFNILLFIIGMMFKKLHKAKNQDAGFFMKSIRYLWRLTFMTGIRFGILIYFFGANLSRTWSIFNQHFL